MTWSDLDEPEVLTTREEGAWDKVKAPVQMGLKKAAQVKLK
jgi:hypothetical protein